MGDRVRSWERRALIGSLIGLGAVLAYFVAVVVASQIGGKTPGALVRMLVAGCAYLLFPGMLLGEAAIGVACRLFGTSRPGDGLAFVIWVAANMAVFALSWLILRGEGPRFRVSKLMVGTSWVLYLVVELMGEFRARL